jgi:hypothetical protein
MSWGRLSCGVVVAVVGLSSLVACGSDRHASPPPSKHALACRAQWKKLGKDIAPQVDSQLPSSLPERWNAVAATVDYYSTSAGSDDCGSRIQAQQEAIAALKSFSAKLTGFDMAAQLDLVRDDAQAYAAGPWPPAPSPSPTPRPKKHTKHQKKHKVAPKPPRPPKPALVGAALTTLTSQAPVATQQQGPGWAQAAVVDLDDATTTAKAIKDLQFLSSQSPAWLACQSALATIRTALAAKTG